MKSEIPKFPGYYADVDGKIYRRLKNGEFRLVKPSKKSPKSDYMKVNLYRDKKSFSKKVHSLILETFVGQKPSYEYVARHLNDISNDNRLCNLAWGTNVENLADKKKLSEQEKGQIPLIVKKAISLGMTEEELSIVTRWNLERIAFLNST